MSIGSNLPSWQALPPPAGVLPRRRSRRNSVWPRLGRAGARRGRILRQVAVTAGAAALAAVGAPLTGIAPAGAAMAAYPGSDGRIAYVHGGNIFSVEFKPAPPFAFGRKQLTRGGHASGPRWSPDGARLAYLYRGNLWIMNANGSRQTQITRAAPAVTDSRPTWSPDGRYLAFVQTRRHHAAGSLIRYDTVHHQLAAFTTTANGHQASVTARPAPVAWTWALNSADHRQSLIVFEGAGPQCPRPSRYCLDALGFAQQDQHSDGTLTAELSSTTTRLSDPDWNAVAPTSLSPFPQVNLLTSVQDCATSPCTAGLSLTLGGAVQQIPGTPAYDGVFAPAATPTGGYIAYVQNLATGGTAIAVAAIPFILNDWRPIPLTAGTEPDWQPTAPFPPS